MPQITQIKPQKNRKRFNIYLDDQFAFGLSAEALARTGLKIDQELSSKEIKTLVSKNELQKLYDWALRFLSYRPHSEKEVRDYLNKKIRKLELARLRRAEGEAGGNWKLGETGVGVKNRFAGRVINQLKKGKLIDDEDFAQWWCQQRIDFRPRGKRMLIGELRQKGIDLKTAQQAVEESIDEEDLAKKLILKKKELFRKWTPIKGRQKMIEYLLRRGFSWEAAKKVIDSSVKKD